MRSGQGGRHDHAGARLRPLDVGIGNAVGVAVREAEIGAFLVPRNPVELVLGTRVAGPVATVVGKPQLARLGMPVEADGIADAARDDLHAGAVRIVATDLPVHAGIDLADVTGVTAPYVELSFGSEFVVFYIVVDIRGHIK